MRGTAGLRGGTGWTAPAPPEEPPPSGDPWAFVQGKTFRQTGISLNTAVQAGSVLVCAFAWQAFGETPADIVPLDTGATQDWEELTDGVLGDSLGDHHTCIRVFVCRSANPGTLSVSAGNVPGGGKQNTSMGISLAELRGSVPSGEFIDEQIFHQFTEPPGPEGNNQYALVSSTAGAWWFLHANMDQLPLDGTAIYNLGFTFLYSTGPSDVYNNSLQAGQANLAAGTITPTWNDQDPRYTLFAALHFKNG